MRKNILFLLAIVLCWNSSSIANCFYKSSKRNVKAVQPPEINYLNFLYKYMALPDKTDYSKSFYAENVALSLQARREMPWGRTVPEREFKHFVLPIRVNNENLDDSRKVFYAELKDRVKNLSMKDAILEVNHWCHEKVTYRPTDGRTSSPLASVCTAYGRCG
ncbi:MAG: transglutaminase domain-containing protein, partial [Prevotella nanceiensis]|nr:transglutaminase domain-containing protein [Hoylesella nanceiensis]